MRNFFLVVCGFILLVGLANSVEETSIVHVDLYLAPTISFEVSEDIYFGNITRNNLESDDVKVYINNTGNVDLTISPDLKFEDEVFENIKMKRVLSDDYSDIGNYSYFIEADEDGLKEGYFYMKLDLTNYTNLTYNELDRNAEVVFYATS